MQEYCRWKTTKALQEEEKIPLRVSQNRETHAVSKFYTRNLLKAM